MAFAFDKIEIAELLISAGAELYTYNTSGR